ncbi:GGDEF domain-containing protein [Desulfofalx alkaliphila]|uniref:GGDEF domain-containing protein n=1 Tax=Desulfofalx alkaliphila TaxID=105483 RepID=UPI0006914395|nr:diguanylate cyclase [Desulfofalx alkaliphila]
MKLLNLAIVPIVMFAFGTLAGLLNIQSLVIVSNLLWLLTVLLLIGLIYFFIRHVTKQLDNLDFNKPSYEPLSLPIKEAKDMDKAFNHLIKEINNYETRQWQKTAEQASKSLKMIFSSAIDCLTGIANRRYLDIRLEEMFNTERRLSVIMLDIDFFKKVNDTYGHQVGDEVLQQFAQIIVSTVREGDFVARYGGEEFTVVTPNSLTQSVNTAERIRKTVESTPIKTSAGTIHITTSIGVAEKEKDDTVKSLLERADNNLYYAKQSGRNKVCKSHPSVKGDKIVAL